MRIAFLSGNREQMPDPVIPLGLLQVMAACPRGHERTHWDLCFEPHPFETLERKLDEERPDLVALGIRNLQGNDYGDVRDQVEHAARLARTVRAASNALLVVGGAGYSLDPERLLEHLGADYGVAGEGEETFAQLVDRLAAGGDPAAVPGLYRLVDGHSVFTGPRPAFADLNDLPPAERGFVDRRHYERCGTDSVQTKRGCPMRCTYCAYPRIEGRVSRVRAPERVVDELEEVAAAGARHFFFVDSVFNLPAWHAEAVCDAMIARGVSLPWTCYANPAAFSARLAERMHQAGCVGVEVGSDSLSDSVLARLSKGFDTRSIRSFHEVACAAGLKDCHTFLLGTPGETLDEVRRCLDLLDAMDPFAAILMVWRPETPEPGLRQQVDREQVLQLLADACRDHPRWVAPALGIRFSERLFRRLRKTGLTGPLWQHLGTREAPRVG